MPLDGWNTNKSRIKEPVRTLIYGRTCTGKTYESLSTTREPIALLHFSERLTGTLDHADFADKEIYHINCRDGFGGKNAEELMASAQVALANLMMRAAEAGEHASTIVIDTATELWQLFRYAHFGGLKPAEAGNRFELYGPINALYRAFLSLLEQHGADTIFIASHKPIYIDHKETSNIAPDCHKNLENYCTDILEMSRIDGSGGPTFRALVKKCANVAFIGQYFDNMTLADIRSVLYGEGKVPCGKS